MSLVLGPLLRHVTETSVTVWVETDGDCVVDVLGRTARTFGVHGHHYALVVVDGLAPGARVEYEVRIDGEVVWPQPASPYPPSVIRTIDPARRLRLIFGSCRHGTPEAIGLEAGYEPDALDTYAIRMMRRPVEEWPDVVLLLGDQVYADETSPKTRRYIASLRSLDEPPGKEVANFEEYTALYYESWRDADVRWLLSTVPSAMIFDDHDIRDDWNSSLAWRLEAEAQPWWKERITGGLASYWVYQHIGNLSPAGLRADQYFSRVHEVPDAGPLLDQLAEASDAEVDSAHAGMGFRWSYRLDLGRVRVVVLDTRCGRVLTDSRRQMMSDDEFDWVEEQLRGDYDHLLIGSTLPWLLPWAIHNVESWNEALAEGSRRRWVVHASERLRQNADLEHWGAFRSSFDRLAELLRAVASGEFGSPPASVAVLSGDVHHAYVATARYPEPTSAPVYQLTCSPVHNSVPSVIRIGFSVGWNRAAAALTRPLARLAGVPPLPVHWSRTAGPFFGNELATLDLKGRSARLTLERADLDEASAPYLRCVAQLTLASAAHDRGRTAPTAPAG